MKNSILTAGVIAVAFSTSVNAQETTKEEMMASAKARSEVYVKNLGVDKATAEKMTAIYMDAEQQMAPLHAEAKNLHAKMEESMKSYDAKALELLTPEQRAKMEVMMKEGKWSGASCGTAEAAKSGCSHEHGAAAGGCCAGAKEKGKGSHTEEHKH